MKTSLRGVAARVACAGLLLGAAVAARADIVFVLNSRDATVSLVDLANGKELRRVPVGKEPHHLYPTPDGRSVIVGNAISNELHFFDPATGDVQRRMRGIDDPYQLGFSPDRRWFVTAALRLNRVDIYRVDGDAFTLVKRVPAPKAPSHIWFSADSKIVFVTLQESHEVAAIDVEKQELLWKVPVGKLPAGIVVTPDDKYLMVGIMGENYVEVIDWRKRETVARIVTGRGAHNFRGRGDGRNLFVSNRVDNTISMIDMSELKVVDTFPVPGGPDCMDVSADQKTMLITTRWAKKLTVIDLDTCRVVRTIPVGLSPHGVFLQRRAAPL